METTTSNRGFRYVLHPKYLAPHKPIKLVSESSAIGDYEDSFEKPGSSYLWIGEHHHLNREEVQELVDMMAHWLQNNRLPE